MSISVVKGTKAEWKKIYETADTCTYNTNANGTASAFQAFTSTVPLDDSQSYWRSVLTNVCSEEWFDEFILSGSELPSSAHAGAYPAVAYLLLGLTLLQM